VSLWRRTAIERMPALRQDLATAENPYSLWIELRGEMNAAYKREPIDDALIAAIYGYGGWCLAEAHNADLATAALVCFYEHLPTDPLLRADVGRWLSLDDFNGLRSIFAYHLSEKELNKFTQEYLAQKKALSKGKHLVQGA
jgi:hypothetical protein